MDLSFRPEVRRAPFPRLPFAEALAEATTGYAQKLAEAERLADWLERFHWQRPELAEAERQKAALIAASGAELRDWWTRASEVRDLLPATLVKRFEAIAPDRAGNAEWLERLAAAVDPRFPSTMTDGEILEAGQTISQRISRTLARWAKSGKTIDHNLIDETCEQLGRNLKAPPRYSETRTITPAGRTKRACDGLHWWRQIRPIVTRSREMLALLLGTVGAATDQQYISDMGLAGRKGQLKRIEENAKRTIMTDQDGYTTTRLAVMRKPEHVDAERYAVLKGMEHWQDGHKWDAAMFTLSLPGEWHPNPEYGHRKGSGWNYASPLKAQREMQRRWVKARARLAKLGWRQQDWFWLAGRQPHRDECPHWHIYITAPKKLLLDLEEICHEIWPGENAVDVIWEDRDKGRLSTYAARYVARGAAGDIPEDEKAERARVDAWGAVWGIPLISIGGVAGRGILGKWREIRRVNKKPEGDWRVEKCWRAARKGDFATFLALTTDGEGKPTFVPSFTTTEDDETGETGSRQDGIVICLTGEVIVTRKTWKTALVTDAGDDTGCAKLLKKKSVTILPNGPRGAAEATPKVSDNGDAAGAPGDLHGWQEGETGQEWIPDPFDDGPPWQDGDYEPGAEG